MSWELDGILKQTHYHLRLIADGTKAPSKREILRLIMSLFDPLGIISNITVFGKIILQDVWRSGVDCDQFVHEQSKDWLKWCLL